MQTTCQIINFSQKSGKQNHFVGSWFDAWSDYFQFMWYKYLASKSIKIHFFSSINNPRTCWSVVLKRPQNLFKTNKYNTSKFSRGLMSSMSFQTGNMSSWSGWWWLLPANRRYLTQIIWGRRLPNVDCFI